MKLICDNGQKNTGTFSVRGIASPQTCRCGLTNFWFNHCTTLIMHCWDELKNLRAQSVVCSFQDGYTLACRCSSQTLTNTLIAFLKLLTLCNKNNELPLLEENLQCDNCKFISVKLSIFVQSVTCYYQTVLGETPFPTLIRNISGYLSLLFGVYSSNH